jgi:hypothetical protein
MPDSNDWRLDNQQTYLQGVTLIWKRYSRPSETWDHDHCEFCWAKFMEGDAPDALHEGYTTEDNKRWICKGCFEDFKEMFKWRVISP